ncbi:hypothetical protein [Solicola sp. PLA-1-18]|uniref:MinD/ParA family ATP-binding protein n=1 Tax=Solicola sp. PLA-1-18 TaxID=3380532 RepID=UPI003B81AFAF
MSGEQFAQRRNAAPPGAAHQQPAERAPQPSQRPPQQAAPQGPPPQGQHAPAAPQPGRRVAPPQQAPQGRPPYENQPQQHREPQPGGWGQQPPPSHAPEPAPVPRGPVSADDFLEGRQRTAPLGPATWGWRGLVRKLTFGLVKPTMGKAEQAHNRDRSAVQRSFEGPRTIVFVNPKGGAAKTTSVLMSGYTFGTVRGGGVVAWDNNETRGTLGVRGLRANHNNTARELLAARERFSDVFRARLGDLGGYVRSQGEAHFDLLASDEQPGVTGTIHADDFRNLHHLLNRFYRMVLVDTGNNIRAENWLAAVDSADLLVVTTTVREDTGYSGLWMLDALVAEGRQDLVARSITILSDPAQNVDKELAESLTQAYASRSKHVVRVPFDRVLVSGSVVDYSRLSDATRNAWLRACAAMAEAL